jgi:hypothetical protein
MDLYCQRCGEPYDFFHVQDEMDPVTQGRFRRGEGCPSCESTPDSEIKPPVRAEAMSVVRDLLGDDEDGMAAMMEDFGDLGLLEGE